MTVIGNPAHDLIRLGLSLASAARGSDLPGVAIARILEELIGIMKRIAQKPFSSFSSNQSGAVAMPSLPPHDLRRARVA
jgi:uncharacterized protein (DUF2252 family)